MREIKQEIPIWEKLNLTIEEAAIYSNIGRDKLTELVKRPDCPFALRKGRVTLIKRREFEKFNSQMATI